MDCPTSQSHKGWEVAKLVEYQRLKLPCEVLDWLNQALSYPGITLIELTPEIVVASTQLNGFHRDPADQIIVATAQVYDCPLVTVDAKITDFRNRPPPSRHSVRSA
jgi:PIN domain nuclease of toxin-antitoxin system